MAETVAAAEAEGPGAGRRFLHALWFLAIASVLSLALAAALLQLVSRADFLTGPAIAVVQAIFAHGLIATLVATSPFLAVLAIGYAYMQRGRRRAAAARAAAEAAAGAGAATATVTT